jgi:hypothetical protein
VTACVLTPAFVWSHRLRAGRDGRIVDGHVEEREHPVGAERHPLFECVCNRDLVPAIARRPRIPIADEVERHGKEMGEGVPVTYVPAPGLIYDLVVEGTEPALVAAERGTSRPALTAQLRDAID